MYHGISLVAVKVHVFSNLTPPYPPPPPQKKNHVYYFDIHMSTVLLIYSFFLVCLNILFT